MKLSQIVMDLTHLRVCLDHKPVIAQVALAAKGVYGRGKVIAYLLLLGVVPDTHANVIIASIAEKVEC